MIGNFLRVTEKELQDILGDSSILEEKLSTANDDHIDVDKCWEAIFFILTGYPAAKMEEVEPPLSWILFSGNVVDDTQDMGIGPANYLTLDQVSQLNRALETSTRETLSRKFNGKEMNEAGVYPDIWNDPESVEYLLDNFDALKNFLRTAEANQMAVITFIG